MMIVRWREGWCWSNKLLSRQKTLTKEKKWTQKH